MARDYTKPNSIRTATEKAYSDIDIFFTRHPVTNDIVVKEDTDAIKRSLRNIILTNNFERPFKPNFGTNITRLLFELNTKEIGTRPLDKIAKKIIQLVKKFPNDQMLGEEIRKIYWEQYKKENKNQLSIFDNE